MVNEDMGAPQDIPTRCTNDAVTVNNDMITSEDSAIHLASRRGDLTVLQACLDGGADVVHSSYRLERSCGPG